MLTFNRYSTHINIYGIARSGIHAIADWLYINMLGNTIYLDNQNQDDEGYTASWEPGSPLSEWQPGMRDVRLKFNYEWGQKFDNAITIFENHDLTRLKPNFHREFGLPSKKFDLLVIRSLRNHYASFIRIKKEHRDAACRLRRFESPNHQKAGIYDLDLWRMYVKEVLNPKDKITVLYDLWCKNLDYRLALLDKLGLPHLKRSLNHVPHYGGGSSFDGTAFNGNAGEMQTLDRWRSLTHEEKLCLLNLMTEDDVRLDAAIDSSLHAGRMA
jgi:hypothetical protein